MWRRRKSGSTRGRGISGRLNAYRIFPTIKTVLQPDFLRNDTTRLKLCKLNCHSLPTACVAGGNADPERRIQPSRPLSLAPVQDIAPTASSPSSCTASNLSGILSKAPRGKKEEARKYFSTAHGVTVCCAPSWLACWHTRNSRKKPSTGSKWLGTGFYRFLRKPCSRCKSCVAPANTGSTAQNNDSANDP